MKKLFYATLVALAGLAVASCNPTNDVEGGGETKAPVLSNIEGAVLDAQGADITTTFTAADFGQSVSINYALYVDKAGNNMANKSEVKADIANGTITIKQTELSLAIMALGVEVGEEVEVELALVASVGSATLTSNLVKATFTTCAAEVSDNDVYKRVYVIGNFNEWNFGNVNQFLYDYEDNGIYTGVIYFDTKANKGFKLTGAAEWSTDSDKGNFGTLDGAVLEEEQAEIQLRNDGGSGNIDCYAFNFYKFEFDRENMILKVPSTPHWEGEVPVRFDYLYLVGDFNGWTTFDPAYKMKYIPSKHKFYADVEVTAAGGFKFLADGNFTNDWYLAWGEKDGVMGTTGVDNIAITEGKFRVYFDLNKLTYSFDSAAFGTEEEGGVEVSERDRTPVEKPDEYSLIGSLYGDTWSKDLSMSANEDNTVFTYKGLAAEKDQEFKIRKNKDWDAGAYGAPAGGFTLGTPFVAGGDNIVVPETCGLDITFEVATTTITIAKSEIQGWSVIGQVDGSNWDKDFVMTKSGNVWTSETLKIDGEFKIRQYGGWDVNRGVGQDVKLSSGAAGEAVAGGANIAGFDGKNVVVAYDESADTITVTVK